MTLEPITPTELGNFMVNMPREYRDFMARGCEPGFIAERCVAIKNGLISKQEVMRQLREKRVAWLASLQ